MTAAAPDWREFDPSSGGLPGVLESVPPASDHPGRVVVLLASDAVDRSGWGARAAVAISRAWAGQGARVFLGDLGLEDPRLHQELGETNTEGLADTFAFGASIQHIARSVDGGAFFFAPAGSILGDPAAALRHPRWEVVTAGFSEAGATLVLYVPASLPGAEALVERAGVVIALTERDEAPPAVAGGTPLLAAIGPSADLAQPVAGASADVSQETAVAAAAASSAEAGTESIDAGEVAAPPSSADRPSAAVAGPGAGRGRPPRRWRWGIVAAGAVVAVAGGALALAVWLGYLPGTPGSPAPGPPPPPAGETAARETVAVPRGDVLAWSLLVDTFYGLEEALAQARTLRERLPEHMVVVAPVESPSGVSYRVLAGSAPDSTGAAALAQAALGALPDDNPERWSVVSTPLAYQLGGTSSLPAARRRVEVLLEFGIPSYAVETPYSDGSVRYRVLGGAYADEEEAEVLLELLTAHGITNAPLTERIGRQPE